MKKRYFLSAICFLLLFALSVPAFAGGERAYNWYFMRSPDHKVPPCPGEFQKLLSHDAYFLDTSATPDDKVIYLTFDAGYENGNIAKILDTLAAHNVQGAFFIL